MQQNEQVGKKEHKACFTVCKVCEDGGENETVKLLWNWRLLLGREV